MFSTRCDNTARSIGRLSNAAAADHVLVSTKTAAASDKDAPESCSVLRAHETVHEWVCDAVDVEHEGGWGQKVVGEHRRCHKRSQKRYSHHDNKTMKCKPTYNKQNRHDNEHLNCFLPRFKSGLVTLCDCLDGFNLQESDYLRVKGGDYEYRDEEEYCRPDRIVDGRKCIGEFFQTSHNLCTVSTVWDCPVGVLICHCPVFAKKRAWQAAEKREQENANHHSDSGLFSPECPCLQRVKQYKIPANNV